jgi:hypothetical protein
MNVQQEQPQEVENQATKQKDMACHVQVEERIQEKQQDMTKMVA